MQALVELSIPAGAMSEDDFACLAMALEGLGQALETDADSGVSLHVAWFEAGDDTQLLRARITAAALLAGVAGAVIQLRELDDDWETAWQKDWRAMPIGERLWVRPSFCAPPPAGRLDIVLDPGMAFGTGTHATTSLCLTAIEALCGRETPHSLLDLGAGSGILAIAAARLGVPHVLAIDNDPIAVEACVKNARINGVPIECRLADAPPAQAFDVVVANILAGPLISLAAALAASAKGHLLLSGLLGTQTNEVAKAYAVEGMRLLRIDRQGEWAALLLTK
ncbi:MAG: 50S ribosomal protein L11 methyltransferase [Mariprofundaceae bacterium]